MIDVYNGQITDILPGNLKETADVHALSYALMRACQRLQSAADKTRVYADTSSLPEIILDVLAVEMRTQFYDESFPIKTKQELIKNTLTWYAKAGTVAAVKEPLETIFGNGEIEEWFEYGGLPHHFRIVTRQGDISYEDKKQLTSILEIVKRKSTVLDYITIIFNDTIISTNALTSRVVNRIRMSPFNKPVIALRDGWTKRNGLATRAGYEDGIPYPFDTITFNRLVMENSNCINKRLVNNVINKNIIKSSLNGVRHTSFLQSSNNVTNKTNNRLILSNKGTHKANNTYFILLNNNYQTKLNMIKHFISFKFDNKLICNAVTKVELKNVNNVTSSVLTTSAPLRRNGRYKRDGTAYRDGQTAKYTI